MNLPRSFALAAASLTFFAGVSPQAQEADSTGNTEERDWLEFYYQDPRPNEFVTEFKKLAADGTLDNKSARPAVIGFLSQVIRQNRDKIASWYEELSSLSEDTHRQILHTGMLLSRTSESDAILKERFGKAYEEQKKQLPKILEMNLAQQNTLDMLWGFFYATGSKDAIRRVVWAFRFDEAPDNPDFVKIPKDHRPLYKELPDAAAWTLKSNAERHPLVTKFCQEFYADEDELLPTEKRLLGEMITSLGKDQDATDAEEN